MKILFHIDTHERWGVLLHQIHNTLRDAQNRVEDVDIQVVAVGTGVIALQQPVAENLGFIDNMRELSRAKACVFVPATMRLMHWR